MSKAIKPMLVSETPGHKARIMSQPFVYVQPKRDGWCCVANARTRKIYTRNGNEITNLPHINEGLPEAGPEWLHGELYIEGGNCDDVQRAVKNGDPEKAIGLFVFDCVLDEEFGSRIERVYDAMSHRPLIWEPHWAVNDTVRPVIHTQIMTYEIQKFYERYLAEGYEGIIIRLTGATYEHGRSINVFKIKPGTEGV